MLDAIGDALREHRSIDIAGDVYIDFEPLFSVSGRALLRGTTRRLPGVSTTQTRTTGNTKKGLKVAITIAGDVDDPMLAQRGTDSVKHSLQHLGTKVEVSVEVEKKQELGTDV